MCSKRIKKRSQAKNASYKFTRNIKECYLGDNGIIMSDCPTFCGLPEGKIVKMNRRMAREKAVQALFQIDVGKADPSESISNVLEDEEQPAPFVIDLVKGTVEHAAEIDPLIEKQLRHWNMERISKVDRVILRIAVYELRFMKDIPRNVTLNEAVELAKRFGGEESRGFVNGVLSSIAKERGNE